MKCIKHYFLLFVLCSISTSKSFAQNSDSIIINSRLAFTAASSYTANVNWQEKDFKSFSIASSIDTRHNRISQFKNFTSFSIKGQLSYIKFIDSLWHKNIDNWRVTAQHARNSDNNLKHTYSMMISSQFTNTYRYKTKNDSLIKEWRGGFFNPSTIILAYGLQWNFWEISNITFSFASIKIVNRPRYDNALLPTEKELARTHKSFIITEYGMNIQALIEKEIYKDVTWENNLYFFANGINKNQIMLDGQNRLTVKFLKYLHFRVENHFVYDPLYSYKMQLRQEFLIGFMFESKVKRKK